ncbi:MAG: riboflavin synthase subunit alpha [gamma proteobacterium symbiont of Taylorina sp.]|nr:riboflavin synthase subunit alpha [gamma proteobacterium symbiont of Taylorina sp.]
MFTGIVQGVGIVIDIIKKDNFQTHVLQLKPSLLENLQIGASIAHNGCCLTVTAVDNDLVSFDLMQETLNITNLGELCIGQGVNIERAARFGDEIGGHQMSGHILFTAKVSDIIQSENNYQIWFEIPQQYQKFIFNKGYIGIDGISLTIGEVRNSSKDNKSFFNVNLIPETLLRTNIGTRQAGNRINIEIDPQTQAIVESVERIMAEKPQGSESNGTSAI